MIASTIIPPVRLRPKRIGKAAVDLANLAEYTTGQTAYVAGVAPRTVSKWIDSGQLKGYRLPGCQDRRVVRGELARFLTAAGMEHRLDLIRHVPNPVALGVEVAVPGPLPAGWSRRLTDYATGLLAAATDPAVAVVLVHASVGVPLARQFAASVRDVRTTPPLMALAVGADSEAPAGDWLHGPAAGFDLVLQEPIDPAVLWAAAGAKATVAS